MLSLPSMCKLRYWPQCVSQPMTPRAAVLDCGQYLVQYFLQEGGSHAISHVSVGWVREKKLPLCSQSCLNVLLAIYVLLTSVDHTNVTCESEVRDQMVAKDVNETQT